MRAILIVLVILATCFTALPAFSQELPPPDFVVASANLRIRSLPTVSAPRLQTVDAGTTLAVYGRSADAAWLQVGYRGVVGWASAFYVNYSGSLLALPVVDGTDANVERIEERTTSPDGTEVLNGTLVVFSPELPVNVRVEPDINAVRLGFLPIDERATVTLVNPTLDWGQITFNGQTGWVELFAVVVLGDIRTVPVLGEPDSGSDLPLPSGGALSLGQREAVGRVQIFLGERIPNISTLVDILSLGANPDPFIACAPVIPFFTSYSPARSDLELVPELNSIVIDINAALRELNRARAAWLTACGTEGTIVDASSFPTWLGVAQNGLNILQDAQNRLAVLSAR